MTALTAHIPRPCFIFFSCDCATAGQARVWCCPTCPVYLLTRESIESPDGTYMLIAETGRRHGSSQTYTRRRWIMAEVITSLAAAGAFRSNMQDMISRAPHLVEPGLGAVG